MDSGQLIEAGKLRFYISPQKICVQIGAQFFNIVVTDGRYKKRIPELLGRIILQELTNIEELHSAMNIHDEHGDIKARVFKLELSEKRWNTW